MDSFPVNSKERQEFKYMKEALEPYIQPSNNTTDTYQVAEDVNAREELDKLAIDAGTIAQRVQSADELPSDCVDGTCSLGIHMMKAHKDIIQGKPLDREDRTNDFY